MRKGAAAVAAAVAAAGRSLLARRPRAKARVKVRKQTKKEEGKVKDMERDEFDEMADKQNVRQRINSGDNAKVKKQRNESGGAETKQTKLNFKPVDKKPKRNPWSDVDSDEDIADVDSPDAAPPRSKPSRMGSKKSKNCNRSRRKNIRSTRGRAPKGSTLRMTPR